MSSNINFYEYFVPFIHKIHDPNEALKAMVDGWQEEYDLLCTKANSFRDLYDISKVDCKYLPLLADLVGVDLESCDPCSLQREQVRNAVPIYKLKGTIAGYELLLRTLGFSVEVQELFENAPDSLFSLFYNGKLVDTSNTGNVLVSGSNIIFDPSGEFIESGTRAGHWVRFRKEETWHLITEVVDAQTIKVENNFTTIQENIKYSIYDIESYTEHNARYKDPGDSSLPTFIYDRILTPILTRDQVEDDLIIFDEDDGIFFDTTIIFDDPSLVADTIPYFDSDIFLMDGKKDFNFRVKGYHAASKLNIELRRLPEAINLELCGLSGALGEVITGFALERILNKVEEITPVHVIPNVIFVIDVNEENDVITITDIDQVVTLPVIDFFHAYACCMYGYNADPINAIPDKFDTDLIMDNYSSAFDSFVIGTGEFASGFDVGLFFDESFFDNDVPALVGDTCYYNNGVMYTYNGETIASGNDLSISTGDDIVTTIIPLPDVEENYFFNIQSYYYLIVEKIDDNNFRVNKQMTDTLSDLDFTVVSVDSYNFIGTTYIDESISDTVVTYYSDEFLPNYQVFFDLGFTFDEGFLFDDSGEVYGCGMDTTATLQINQRINQFRVNDNLNGFITWKT